LGGRSARCRQRTFLQEKSDALGRRWNQRAVAERLGHGQGDGGGVPVGVGSVDDWHLRHEVGGAARIEAVEHVQPAELGLLHDGVEGVAVLSA